MTNKFLMQDVADQDTETPNTPEEETPEIPEEEKTEDTEEELTPE